jgi:hypothetical protein
MRRGPLRLMRTISLAQDAGVREPEAHSDHRRAPAPLAWLL